MVFNRFVIELDSSGFCVGFLFIPKVQRNLFIVGIVVDKCFSLRFIHTHNWGGGNRVLNKTLLTH